MAAILFHESRPYVLATFSRIGTRPCAHKIGASASTLEIRRRMVVESFNFVIENPLETVIMLSISDLARRVGMKLLSYGVADTFVSANMQNLRDVEPLQV